DSLVDVGERWRDRRRDRVGPARGHPPLRPYEAADEAHDPLTLALERRARRHERAERDGAGCVAHRGDQVSGAVRQEMVDYRRAMLDEIALARAEGGDGVGRGEAPPQGDARRADPAPPPAT